MESFTRASRMGAAAWPRSRRRHEESREGSESGRGQLRGVPSRRISSLRSLHDLNGLHQLFKDFFCLFSQQKLRVPLALSPLAPSSKPTLRCLSACHQLHHAQRQSPQSAREPVQKPKGFSASNPLSPFSARFAGRQRGSSRVSTRRAPCASDADASPGFDPEI